MRRPALPRTPSARLARPVGLRALGQAAWVGLFLALSGGPTLAQERASHASASPASAPKAAVATGSGWRKLTPSQRQALQPLASTWDALSPGQQRKWLEISRNYPSMGAVEQAKMHERMAEWVALSPKERAQARLNFGKTTEIAKELSPSEKMARWQAYQALPPEERQKLTDSAKTRPLGAAPALKPVPAEKLAVVPPVATARAAKPAETPSATTETAATP